MESARSKQRREFEDSSYNFKNMRIFSNLLKVFGFGIVDFLPRLQNWRWAQKSNTIFSNDATRSDSDSTEYTQFVNQANRDSVVFENFRRSATYRLILEHVTYQLGKKYLKKLPAGAISSLGSNQVLKNLSTVGNPRTFTFKNVGSSSPTILRYVSVASDLRELFGEDLGTNLVEIGIGFGGQYAVLQEFYDFGTYHFFDLPEVIELANKFLLNAEVETNRLAIGDIESPEVPNCDFVMSNYAFSELPSEVQARYISRVMAKSKRGYLIMNSGRTDFTGRSGGKLSLEQLRELLPPFELMEENPNTGPDNYVIVWGHRSAP